MAIERADCRGFCLAVADCCCSRVASRSTRLDLSLSCPEREGLGPSMGLVAPDMTTR